MSESMSADAPALDLSRVPILRRDAFGDFARALQSMAGDELIGLGAFGGWVVADPLYAQMPARSVAVLRDVTLKWADRFGQEGETFGARGVAAPLLMSPEYIAASLDVFPLELLEIRHQLAHVVGEDHFSELVFEPRDIRLQCERELKSELIQIRQGVLAAAGRRGPLTPLVAGCAERTIRILRGLLVLRKAHVPRLSMDIARSAAGVVNSRLTGLLAVLERKSEFTFEHAEGFYQDISDLAEFVDGLDA